MNGPRVWLARILDIFRGRRLERELGEELQHHLDLLAEEYVKRGLSPADARAAARRDFGGVDRAAEEVRDRRGFRPMDRLVRDVRYALRLLARTPGFTLAAALTLALGIGANTAIFSLVDAAMLRPLPYRDPDRLVSIWELTGGASGPASRTAVAPANLADYRRARSLSSLAAFALTSRAVSGRGEPERLLGEEVTAGYFDVLGAAPAIGRPIVPADNQEGHELVAVLSHGIWRDRFGARTGVIGEHITLDDRRYEIIGVMPPEFTAVSQFARPDPIAFWTPSTFSAELLANRRDHEVEVVARLAPGASPAQARDELRAVAAAFETTTPQTPAVDLMPLQDDVAKNVRTLLVLLLGAVGLVLLLACVNVASLLVVRSLARRREIAVRIALGATRGRVARELVTQSLVLATLGAAAGWVLAVVLKDLLVALTPTTMPRLDAVELNGRVLTFTAALAGATGLAFGLLPAWQLSRTPPIEALGGTDRTVAGSWGDRGRSALIVIEAALSMLLLVGAGLMIRSLTTLNRVDLGFDPANILSVNVSLPANRYPTPDARLRFFDELASRVAAVPGVRTVSFANRLPLRGLWSSGFELDPRDVPAGRAAKATAGFQSVSPGYFPMFGLGAIRGRVLGDSDREGQPGVAVVNEEFSRAFLGGLDPIGRSLRRFEKAPWVRIVGVVPDIRREGKMTPDGKMTPVAPQVYLAAAQTSLYPLPLAELAVLCDRQPEALAGPLRAAVWAIDPDQPVSRVQTLERTLALRQADRNFQTLLFSLFAGLALLLAVVGIFGVVSYVVSQRTAEIGLRLALGADPGRIVRWIVGHAFKLVAAGAVSGLGLAFWLSRSLRALLFETSPTDFTAYAGAACVLSVAAVAACYIAARRATRVDPATVLK